MFRLFRFTRVLALLVVVPAALPLLGAFRDCILNTLADTSGDRHNRRPTVATGTMPRDLMVAFRAYWAQCIAIMPISTARWRVFEASIELVASFERFCSKIQIFLAARFGRRKDVRKAKASASAKHSAKRAGTEVAELQNFRQKQSEYREVRFHMSPEHVQP